METSFTELRSKFVVNVTDGKNLGRTCDIIFSFPEAHVFGIVVPGKRFRIFKNNDLFIPLKNIIKIGTDVVLVDLRSSPRPDPHGKRRPQHSGRRGHLQPFRAGGKGRQEQGGGRRSYEEYE